VRLLEFLESIGIGGNAAVPAVEHAEARLKRSHPERFLRVVAEHVEAEIGEAVDRLGPHAAVAPLDMGEDFHVRAGQDGRDLERQGIGGRSASLGPQLVPAGPEERGVELEFGERGAVARGRQLDVPHR